MLPEATGAAAKGVLPVQGGQVWYLTVWLVNPSRSRSVLKLAFDLCVS